MIRFGWDLNCDMIKEMDRCVSVPLCLFLSGYQLPQLTRLDGIFIFEIIVLGRDFCEILGLFMASSHNIYYSYRPP